MSRPRERQAWRLLITALLLGLASGCQTVKQESRAAAAKNSLVVKNNSHYSLEVFVDGSSHPALRVMPHQTTLCPEIVHSAWERARIDIHGTYQHRMGCLVFSSDAGSRTYHLTCGTNLPQQTVVVHWWTLH